jgi:hypothetical protein
MSLLGPEGAVGGDLVDSSKYDKQIEELKASLKKAEEKEKEVCRQWVGCSE